jgi:hypothetical protein
MEEQRKARMKLEDNLLRRQDERWLKHYNQYQLGVSRKHNTPGLPVDPLTLLVDLTPRGAEYERRVEKT